MTLPRLIAPSSQLTGVILWGLCENVGALVADHYIWLNINLQMIYQGVAKPTVHIEQFNRDFSLSINAQCEMNKQAMHQTNRHECQMSADVVNGKTINRKKHRNDFRWLAAQLCRSKEFTGNKCQCSIYSYQSFGIMAIITAIIMLIFGLQ